MVDSLEKLQDLFLLHRVSANTMRNPLAREAWEKALESPTREKIWTYYCCAGLEEWGRDVAWSEI